jgi:hypothetical protein
MAKFFAFEHEAPVTKRSIFPPFISARSHGCE